MTTTGDLSNESGRRVSVYVCVCVDGWAGLTRGLYMSLKCRCMTTEPNTQRRAGLYLISSCFSVIGERVVVVVCLMMMMSVKVRWEMRRLSCAKVDGHYSANRCVFSSGTAAAHYRPAGHVHESQSPASHHISKFSIGIDNVEMLHHFRPGNRGLRVSLSVRNDSVPTCRNNNQF